MIQDKLEVALPLEMRSPHQHDGGDPVNCKGWQTQPHLHADHSCSQVLWVNADRGCTSTMPLCASTLQHGTCPPAAVHNICFL